ncbi:glycosyltransferase family 87 protein [uncultured Ruegeria sp.]|uniref:glycosyltransferase family 87 protein n=1 Tax=uncultured Ruegeria sp. TaxID=259304 RepID=UPI0026097C57|nr:glycosyltransferase family 87 protein [uncultured Ruegeria sp.]
MVRWNKYLFFIMISLLCLAVLVLYFATIQNGYDFGDYVVGRDFLNTHTGGMLISEGRWGILFQPENYWVEIKKLHGADYPVHGWSYPPLLWPVSQFLALFPYFPAYLIWTLSGMGLVFVAARICGLKWFWGVFVCLSPAGVWNIFAGQNGFFISSLMMIAVALKLKNRNVAAGLTWAMVAIKPHLGLCVLPMLVGQRRLRVIVWGAVFLAGAIALTAFFYGFEVWRLFLAVTSKGQVHVIETWEGPVQWMMPSPFMQGRLLDFGVGQSYLFHIAFALICAVLLILRWPGRSQSLSRWILWLVLGTLLLLPYSFVYDLVMLQFAAAMWFERDRNLFSGRAQRREPIVIAIVWLLPILSALGALAFRVQFAPFFLLFVLYHLPPTKDEQ